MKKNRKITGFKTPENYFDNFEDQLFGRIEEDRFPRSAGFKVPDGYFSNFEVKIFSKEIIPQKTTKVFPLFPRRYFGYAAAIAACLVIGLLVLNPTKSSSSLDNVQIGLIDKYIEEGNLNIDLYDLTTYLEPHEIRLVDFEAQDISQADLKAYLLENTEEGIFLDGGN